MNFEIKIPTQKLIREDLLQDLKRVSNLLGSDTIKAADYNQHGKYAYTSFRNHFGTWKNALEEASLNRGRNWGSTIEDLLVNLKDVWIKLGRQPKYDEMTIPFSKFSSTAYAHKFGNWTKTLIAFQKYLEEDGEIESLSSFEVTPSTDGHKTKRNPNWRLRFKVMKRDNFRCVACGRSPAKNPEVELHVDHIKPWSKGGETVIENLQTLCVKCNLGKGNLEE